MQDRFKFRFWDKETQTMQRFPMIELRQRMTLNAIFNNDRVIFMQSTDLKDKNGKLIFEGDILRVLGVPCKVAFELGEFVFVRNSNFITINDWHDLLEDCWNDDTYSLGQLYFLEGISENCINKVEIIGNIYENPELLKD